ncbi:MAG: Fur family transcriptional regulator, ferric uptake regulator [Clostridia bacterium]|jgi:Fur family ferric uptake transcriptional regulator|nr:Fur family transcriptional regulator, ferric uptake regulator [Clostridia bacterium]MDN5323960.1 Fur family transcriptional regulator, ferric uptake regulator [Clostridia bacterium]
MTHFEDIKSRLKAKDYKMTPQRKVIINAFAENMEKHLSAEEVFQIVKTAHPEIGLATVYRTLELLAELQILKKMNFGDGRSRYEFCEEDDHHHHHLICLECEKVTEFEDDLLESLEAIIGKKNGFKVIDHQLKFYGFCKNCQEKKSKD